MNPIQIPETAKRGRRDCRLVRMGPPVGVREEHVGTTEMLISDLAEDIPNYAARRQYVYFRPSPDELEVLAAGGFIEFCQYGNVVQPFSAEVKPDDAPSPSDYELPLAGEEHPTTTAVTS